MNSHFSQKNQKLQRNKANSIQLSMHLLLVCLEPLVEVTGGIGTYTRELARLLVEKGENVTIITKKFNNDHKLYENLENVNIHMIDDQIVIPNNIFPAQLADSYRVWFLIKELIKTQKFDFIEFPDYEATAFYTVMDSKIDKTFPPIYIRLHSPTFMLHDDNMVSSYDLSTMRLRASEYESILKADGVLYAAPQMLNRVLKYFANENQILNLFQVSHPMIFKNPKIGDMVKGSPNNIIRVGLIGRQEFRKGWDLIFRNGKIEWEKFEFHFYGRDTSLPNGASCQEFIQEFIPAQYKNKVIFHGYLSPDELRIETQTMDAFIFPSRFENFPNALLEVLGSGKPILVSEHGGMPFISESYSNSKSFDPQSKFSLNWLLRPPDNVKQQPGNYEEIHEAYQNLVMERFPANPANENISIVIPLGPDDLHLSEAIGSCLSVGNVDEILVIGNNRDEQPAYFQNNTATFIQYKQTNFEGPAQARRYGANIAKNQIIQFLDADDLIVSNVVMQNASAMASRGETPCLITSAMRVFGHENHEWMPSSTSASLIASENFTHSGIMVNKKAASYLTDVQILHDEDWIQSINFVFEETEIIINPKIGYFYRSHDKSRSKKFITTRFETNYLRKNFYQEKYTASKIPPIFIQELSGNFSSGSQSFELFGRLENIFRSRFYGTKLWPTLRWLARRVFN